MGASQSNLKVLDSQEIKEQIQIPHTELIKSLNPEEYFTLQQYIYKGDVLLNSFLRGTDNLELYQDFFISFPDYIVDHNEKIAKKDENIAKKEGYRRLYFIPLFLLGYTEDPNQYKNGKESTIILQRCKYYTNIIKPIIEKEKDNLQFFQNIMFRFFQQFMTIANRFSLLHITKPFQVYRGVRTMYYSKDKTKVNILPSFESTSLNINIGATFSGFEGELLYYIIAPECKYTYIQKVSQITPKEEEILLLPGHRYCYIYTNMIGSHVYAILPPTDETMNLVMNTISKGVMNSQGNKNNNVRSNSSSTRSNNKKNKFNNAKYIKNVTNWVNKKWIYLGGKRQRKRYTRRRQKGGVRKVEYPNRWESGHENVIIRSMTKEEENYLESLKAQFME